MFYPRIDVFRQSERCQVQTCMRRLPYYCITHQECHSERNSSHLWSRIYQEQVTWLNCHHLHPHMIPWIYIVGVHQHQELLYKIRRKGALPGNRGLPFRCRWTTCTIKESERLGVSEHCSTLAISHRGGITGLRDIISRDHQDLCHQYIRARIRSCCQ